MFDHDAASERDAITANFRARQRAMVDGDTQQLRQRGQRISTY